MKIINNILDVIFPSSCIICGKRNTYLCINCLKNCPEAERENLKWIYSIFDYRHPTIKKAVWSFKYKNKRNLAKTFAENLYPRIIEELSDLILFENFKKSILIPIPLSRKRFKERGYNQAFLICRELEKIDQNKNFEIEEKVLFKIKETEHQAHINDKRKRIQNLINTFSVKNTNLIKNRNIILIDDVTTTGATLNEARKILKQNGARKIIAFTVAH